MPSLSSLRIRTSLTMAAVVLASLLATALLLMLGAWDDERRDIEARAQAFASLTTGPIAVSYETYYRSGYFKFRELIPGFPAPLSGRAVGSAGRRDGRRAVRLEPSRRRGDTRHGDRRQPAREPRSARGGRPAGSGPAGSAPTGGSTSSLRTSKTGDATANTVIYRFGYDSLTPRIVQRAYVTGGLALVALFAALALGLVLMRRITRPLEQLTAGARGIAQGRFEESLDVRSGRRAGDARGRLQPHVGRAAVIPCDDWRPRIASWARRTPSSSRATPSSSASPTRCPTTSRAH